MAMLFLNFSRLVHIVSSGYSLFPREGKFANDDHFVTNIGRNSLEVNPQNLETGSG